MGQHQLRGPDGSVAWADDDHLAHALEQGYTPISDAEASDILTKRDTSDAEGIGGAIGAGLTSAASGATLGLSDVALRGILSDRAMQDVADERSAHPIISTLGNVAGAVAPALLTGGASAEASAAELGGEALGAEAAGAAGGAETGLGAGKGLLAKSPAALVSDLGGAVADLGEGAGFAGRTLAKTAAGAAEGAAYGAGGYVSDVALGNKDLSADGFTAAMGQGALWGGVAGGALSVTGEMLSSARKLFPKESLTREAVDASTRDAADAVNLSINEADAMHLAAKRALREMRDVEVAHNPMLADHLEDMAQRRVTMHALDNPELVDNSPLALEDHVNAEYAKANPEAAKIVRAQSELHQSTQNLREWAGQELPAPAARSAAPWDPTQPLDIMAEDLPGHGAAPAPQEPIDLGKTLGRQGSSGDINVDLEKAGDIITRHEAASADLAEALGPQAPPTAVGKAQAFRAAQQSAEQRTAQGAHEAADQVARAAPHVDAGMPSPFADEYATNAKVGEVAKFGGTAAAPAAKGGGLVGMFKSAGAMKTLGLMGIATHALHGIPVIGPVLSTVANAMLHAKAFSRFGGKLAETAETAIAGKHADTMNRMSEALGKVFEGGGRKVAAAAGTGGAVADILAHKLFDGGPPAKQSYSSTPEKGEAMENFRKRSDELVASQAPGAVRDAVAARVKTSDPAVLDAIVAAQQRKLDFLYSKLPKPEMAPSPFHDAPYTPAKSDLTAFARIVKACDDPMSVLEKVHSGGIVTPDEVQAISTCYPQLYGELQKSVLAKAAESKTPMPRTVRAQLGALVGMPLDHSSSPQLGAFLQQNYKAAGSIEKASGVPPPQSPFNPNVTIQDRISNRLDRG